MIMGGKIAMLGIPSGPTQVDWNRVIFKSLTIKGIYGREMYETWYKMAVLVQSGLDISPVITHRFDYQDYEEAFTAARSGHAGKVIMRWAEPTHGR
jgi:threonine 3-dehydrogenase